jgi:helicase MOV-10
LIRIRRDQASKEEEELMQRITESVEKHVTLEGLDELGDGYEAVERPWREAN